MKDYNKAFSVKIYNYYYWFQRIIAWLLYKVIFRCEVIGRENIDFSQTFLIVANHCSNIDPPLVGFAVPKPIAYMAKSDFFKIPIFKDIIRFSGAFAVKKASKDQSYIDNTIYALKNGWLVTIFPEGGRSLDGKLMLKEIKPGVAKILLKHNVPLLPVALIDTHIAWGKHKKMKPFTKMTVKIGKTIYPKEYLPESTLPEAEQIEHIKI